MYRSSIVRSSPKFFDEGLQCSDIKTCLEILLHWDLGFVHQVPSFTRPDYSGHSVTSSHRPSFYPFAGDYYIMEQLYGTTFLPPAEAVAVSKRSKRMYYRVLAKAVLQFRAHGFWQYHRHKLKLIDKGLDWKYLVLQIRIVVVWALSNPGMLLSNILHPSRKREH
jgi:hypothetical protein